MAEFIAPSEVKNLTSDKADTIIADLKRSILLSSSSNNLKSKNSSSGTYLHIVKSDVAPSGESVQLIRPMINEEGAKTSEQIVGELVNTYDYKGNEFVKASKDDLGFVQQAFGANLTTELLNSYDGSSIITDNKQDLVGEQYLAKQIKNIEEDQRKRSIIDRYAYLLYEGEKCDVPAYIGASQFHQSQSSSSFKPIQVKHSASNIRFDNFEEKYQQNVDQYVVAAQSEQARRELELLESERLEAERLEAERIKLELEQQEILKLDQAIQEQMRQEEALVQEEAERQKQIEQEKIIMEQIRLDELLNEQKSQKVEEVHYQQAQEQKEFRKSMSASSVYANADIALNGLSPNIDLLSPDLKQITLDAHNDPQFKAMLELLMKPFNMPVEKIEQNAEWPSQDKIAKLSEPIVIPAPEPIVIHAPDILKLSESDYRAGHIPDELMKPTITYFPSLSDKDLKFYQDFTLKQLNLDA